MRDVRGQRTPLGRSSNVRCSLPKVTFRDGTDVGVGSRHLDDGRATTSRRAEIAALTVGFDLGMTLIDTAEMYGVAEPKDRRPDDCGRRDVHFWSARCIRTMPVETLLPLVSAVEAIENGSAGSVLAALARTYRWPKRSMRSSGCGATARSSAGAYHLTARTCRSCKSCPMRNIAPRTRCSIPGRARHRMGAIAVDTGRDKCR
jgi:hypothetical protein